MRMLLHRAWIIVVCLMLGACSTAPATDPGYTLINAGSIQPGDSIPPPAGTVLLILTGKIGVTNIEDRLEFDMETLERVGLVEYTVDDPHLVKTVTYQGVLLEQLLAVAQMSPDATELRATAVDDYQTIIPLRVMQWPVIVATRRDGERMPLTAKGPLQIAFPYNTFEIDPIVHDPMWVWHLAALEVR